VNDDALDAIASIGNGWAYTGDTIDYGFLNPVKDAISRARLLSGEDDIAFLKELGSSVFTNPDYI